MILREKLRKEEKMMKRDKIIELLVCGSLGSSSLYASGVTTFQVGEGNLLQGAATLCTGIGMTFGPTGYISESSKEPDIVVRTEDNNDYAATEVRAQKIYDAFHKNHDINNKPSVLIADTPEQFEALTELLNMFGSKRELYIYLSALQEVFEDLIAEEEQKNKTKKLSK